MESKYYFFWLLEAFECLCQIRRVGWAACPFFIKISAAPEGIKYEAFKRTTINPRAGLTEVIAVYLQTAGKAATL